MEKCDVGRGINPNCVSKRGMYIAQCVLAQTTEPPNRARQLYGFDLILVMQGFTSGSGNYENLDINKAKSCLLSYEFELSVDSREKDM